MCCYTDFIDGFTFNSLIYNYPGIRYYHSSLLLICSQIIFTDGLAFTSLKSNQADATPGS